METIATLHLMVGLPCSGKTTFARELERKYSALRLTPDEWHIQLFGQDLDHKDHGTRHALVESLLWDVAAKVLILDVDVILDFGFWSRSERDVFLSRATDLGVSFRIHFLDTPEEVLLERLVTRNVQLPKGTFLIPESNLKESIKVFESPSLEELESS